MGMATSFVGYLNYIVFLFLATGGYILWVDVKNYRGDQYKKEKKAAKLLVWINFTLGISVFIGSWVYKRYIW
jgi:hypothetical protein